MSASTDLMPHEELARVGIAAELAREEGTVIVVRIITIFHRALSQARESLSQLLPVHVVLIETGHNGLLLRFRAGAVDVPVVLHPLLLQVGGATGVGGMGRLLIIGGRRVRQIARLLLLRTLDESEKDHRSVED